MVIDLPAPGAPGRIGHAAPDGHAARCCRGRPRCCAPPSRLPIPGTRRTARTRTSRERTRVHGDEGRGSWVAEPETGAADRAARRRGSVDVARRTSPRSGAASAPLRQGRDIECPAKPAAARVVRRRGRRNRLAGSGGRVAPRPGARSGRAQPVSANHPTRSPTRSSRARPAPRRRRAVRRAWRPRCRCCPPSRPRSWPRRWSGRDRARWSPNCTRPEARPRGNSPNG